MAPGGQPSFGSRSVGRSARRLRSRGWRSISDFGDAIARCMRCARASSRRTSSSSRSAPACSTRWSSSASASAGSGRWPSTRPRSSRSAASSADSDLVDALEVVGDPPEAGQLVVAVDRGRRVTQAGDEVPERRGVVTRSRLRDRDTVELVAADLGDRLERPPGTVHVPREVRQPVGTADGIGQRRAGREHRDRVVQDGVVLDDVVVDRDPRDRLVPRRRLRELADVLDRVADPQRGEVHHGIAHVRVFEVEQARDAAALEHELERVVGDEPRRVEPVLRDVVPEPPPEEHRHRVGRQVLHQRVVERLHRAPIAPEGGGRRVDGNVEPGIGGSRSAGCRRRGRGSRGSGRAMAHVPRRRRRRGRRDRGGDPSPARTARRRGRRRAGRAPRAPRAGRGSPPRRRSGTA